MKKDRKQLGRHDWSGRFDPYRDPYGDCSTFSVGIFQWEKKKGANAMDFVCGNGLKRGPVKYRVKGSTAHPKRVYERAEFICDQMDRGDWQITAKSEVV